MGIDMSNYKMIYEDQIYNVININPWRDEITFTNISGESKVNINQIEAYYLDEKGLINIICDTADKFRFIRR